MKKEIQTLLAMQLISLNNDVKISEYYKKEMVDSVSLNILTLLKEAINSGLNIMLPLDEEQLSPNTSKSHFSGYKGKITFFEKMLQSHDCNIKIVEFLYSQLKKEDLEIAHPKFVKNIYEVLFNNGISMKGIFELGFDFEQGKFDEENKATSGDLDFFECCLCNKADFDFKFKYDDFTLKQSIQEQKENNLKNQRDIKYLENLENFIDKAILKQNLENREGGILEKKFKI